jgi:hypothetical protein
MLKITTDTDAGRTILKLAGRLTGPWIEELNACWRDAAAGKQRIEVVLHEITSIDEAGRRLLADMHRRGVQLTAAGCMTKAIVTESIDRRADAIRTGDRTSQTMDERIGSLFQPDSLLVAQYSETLRRKTLFEPEKRLMLAILEDAINCFQDNLLAQDVRSSRLFHEAEEWIVEAASDGVFSFDNVCEALDLNPAP